MNFTEITTEVEKTLARSDADVTDRIATWVNHRQRAAAARYNFSFMRTETTVAITADPASQQDYSLPSDFKDEVVFMLHESNGFTELPIKGRLEMLRRFGPSDEGQPEFITLEPGTGSFRVWPPIPNAAFTVRLPYYQWPADLSGTGTNWFTDRTPQVLIGGGVAEGFWFLGAQEDAAAWEQRFEIEFQRAKTVDAQRLFPSPMILVPRLDVNSPGLTPRRRDGWPWG